MTTSSTLIRINDAVLARGDSILTHPLSMTFEASQIWHVTGENGAGKTTFLMTLLGLLPLYQGTVTFNVDEAPLYIGHRSGLNLNLTVAENLNFLASLHHYHFDHPILQQALTRTGLSAYDDVICSQLSSGQKRRVQLARLWLPRTPSVWILDEPLTALDKAMVEQLENRFVEHIQQGGLIILSSHQDIRYPVHVLNLDDYRYHAGDMEWLPDE